MIILIFDLAEKFLNHMLFSFPVFCEAFSSWE